MSFEIDLKEQPEVDWPVVINVPTDGGKVAPFNVTVRFKLLDGDALKKIDADDKPFGILRKHITGWGDEFVNKQTGKKLEFSEENLIALAKKPWIQRALSNGLISASSGAAAKN